MISEKALDEVVADVQRKFAMKPRVAIAGFGKSGKSSLFNAIYGAQVASVSMRTDETTRAQTEERFGIDFTDTPGMGTARFSFERVVEQGVFERQHVVIHLLNGTTAISAEDEKLRGLLAGGKARAVTAVNKVDLLDEAEQGQFAESVESRLGLPRNEILFISAKRGTGVPLLIERVVERLPAAMQDAFIGQQQADQAIKDRRVRQLIHTKAAVAAAVGAVPLPIADMAVLTPLQIGMVAAIGHFYGVEVTKARALELVATLGLGFGLREGARQLVKLVPGYGSAVSAAIAFGGTLALGEAARTWFRGKMDVPPETLRETFRATAEKARSEFRATAGGMVAKLADLRRRLAAGEIDADDFARRVAGMGDEE